MSWLNQLNQVKYPSLAEIMQNNFTYNLNLTEYAKLACKSVPTFKREFKKIFNDTPAKWVLKKRIAFATELLEISSLTVAEIGIECGFENQTHFSRVFKEKMGVSPSQFRTNRQTA